MKVEPQKEHQWLQQLVGDWTYEGECPSQPGQPPMKWAGSESVKSLGGLWTVADGRGDAPEGGEHTSILTLNYDPEKKRYSGTFVASMMTHLWIYDGALDANGKVLTLDTEGPAMSGDGKMAKYKDIIEIENNDQRVMRSEMLGDDGKWNEVMRMNYRRKQ
jgi:hypothetical protein